MRKKKSKDLNQRLGKIENGVYTSPEYSFSVDVPRMKNPFIKEPSSILDNPLPEGGYEVNFMVPDLGEAYRFGARKLTDSLRNIAVLQEICNQELFRWTKIADSGEILMEEMVDVQENKGIVRIYWVDNASLLFRQLASGQEKRESALVGILAIISVNSPSILYVVSQFDMPNKGGHYTLETENGRMKIARQRLADIMDLSKSFKQIVPKI